MAIRMKSGTRTAAQSAKRVSQTLAPGIGMGTGIIRAGMAVRGAVADNTMGAVRNFQGRANKPLKVKKRK